MWIAAVAYSVAAATTMALKFRSSGWKSIAL
jgi:hypothetical protein